MVQWFARFANQFADQGRFVAPLCDDGLTLAHDQRRNNYLPLGIAFAATRPLSFGLENPDKLVNCFGYDVEPHKLARVAAGCAKWVSLRDSMLAQLNHRRKSFSTELLILCRNSCNNCALRWLNIYISSRPSMESSIVFQSTAPRTILTPAIAMPCLVSQ